MASTLVAMASLINLNPFFHIQNELRKPAACVSALSQLRCRDFGDRVVSWQHATLVEGLVYQGVTHGDRTSEGHNFVPTKRLKRSLPSPN